MGTKNNPAPYDCYANAEDDEPMFVLLARDVGAPALVEAWAEQRVSLGEEQAKVDEALMCAQSMREWRQHHRPRLVECVVCNDTKTTDGADGSAVPCFLCVPIGS